jgi:phenylacetate-CoA ligase
VITARWYQEISERRALRILEFLRKTQFWDYEELRRYQFAKLQRLLDHAYLHVPYYRNLFVELDATPKDIKEFHDFRQIPVLTKQIIKENFDHLVATNIPKDQLIPNATGGSTGEPLHFFQDHHFLAWADAARMRGWYEFAGCHFGDTCAVLWGAMHEVKEDYSFLERLYIYAKYGEIPLNAFNLSNERKLHFLKWCRLLKPKILRGYVSAIKDLALFLDERKLPFPHLDCVIFCAETVDDETQAYVERIFRAPSYNSYGGRELSLMAMECSHKNGLHEVSEANYIEFEEINLSGYKKAGNLIATNLNNYGMPFIRYRIGDIGVPSSKTSCSCGRGLPLIAKVIGRTTEVFVFHDGTRIAGEMFIHLMKDFPLKEYQFVQISDREVVLRVNRYDGVSQALRHNIRSTYRRFLPGSVELDFEEVDGFEKTPTGKFRFVLRELPG